MPLKLIPMEELLDALEQQHPDLEIEIDRDWGRGNDGQKTGLSHQEFNALRDWRIEQARAAIHEAETGEAA